jgi:hypothetical protein
MKLKSLVCAIALTVTTSAFAQWFIQPEIYITPELTIARVHNVWGRPVLCQGDVVAVTASGRWLSAYFRDFVPMGQFREAYVFTNRFDPFLPSSGRANIWCNYL